MEKPFMLLIKKKLSYQVLSQIERESLTPVMISKVTKRPRPTISVALLEMEEMGFVKCDNPKDKKFRFYSITAKGKDALKEAKKYQ